jgi:hypothetical protein
MLIIIRREKMTTVISVFFIVIFLWTGYSAEWVVDYATG